MPSASINYASIILTAEISVRRAYDRLMGAGVNDIAIPRFARNARCRCRAKAAWTGTWTVSNSVIRSTSQRVENAVVTALDHTGADGVWRQPKRRGGKPMFCVQRRSREIAREDPCAVQSWIPDQTRFPMKCRPRLLRERSPLFPTCRLAQPRDWGSRGHRRSCNRHLETKPINPARPAHPTIN